MSCEVIQFSAAARSAGTFQDSLRKGRVEREGRARAAEQDETLTETCKNQRLRIGRRTAWRAANAARGYWRARMDFEAALSAAQSAGIEEGRLHPPCEPEISGRYCMVKEWRQALVVQLLTPAPDIGALTWKRSQLADEQYTYVGVGRDRIEDAIAMDAEWLAAHPTRKSIAASRQSHRREFKEAMRQRIREIAASRDLSDEDIKPVLRLKHEEVGRFCETHGVNLGWLLEGIGPIFKAWPTS